MSITLWNKLDNPIKLLPSLDSFKNKIKKIFTPNKLYSPYLSGNTPDFVYLTRLRLGLSGLNAHRRSYNFIRHSTCPKCQNRNEDNSHFLLSCPAYAAPRAVMITAVSGLVPAAQTWFDNLNKVNENLLTELLINGTKNLPAIDNHIFKYVSKFIESTGRFKFQTQQNANQV